MRFVELCRDGKLIDAQKYHTNNYVNIDGRNWGFQWSCSYGHIGIAKWLYSLGDIDIHARNEKAFRLSCIHGHAKIAKWLYSLGNIDIYAENEYAFRRSCINGRIETAKWLQALCDDYVLTIDGEQISYTIKNTIIDLIEQGKYNIVIDIIGAEYGDDIDDICCICLDNKIMKPIKTKCGHMYCIKCILEYKYVYNKDTCPICIQKLEFIKS